MRARIAPEERFLWFTKCLTSAPLGQLSLKVQVHHLQLPKAMANWSLTNLQLKLIKIGTRVVRHARAITSQLAEVAVTGPMVRTILSAIRRL